MLASELVLDAEEPVEVPVLLPVDELLEPVALAVAVPELMVAPWLNEVGVDAALHVPAVFAAQHASFPSES